MLGFGDLLRLYHRHELVGIEHLRAALDAGRPVVLVGNHSMDVADPMMLRAAIHHGCGKLVPFIGHEMLFFRLPGIRSFATRAGMVPSGDLELAARVLRENRILMIYPGAGSEAGLRSYRREPYRLKWYERLGFVKLALRERAEILFVAGIGIDEMYYQTDIAVPRVLFELIDDDYVESYRGLRIQLGAAGVHVLPGVFPLPVKVTHEISAPLRFDSSADPANRGALERCQISLWAQCQTLLDDVVAARDHRSDWLDTALRRGARVLQSLGL
jgi:1-acyl-sn-glycerol-3-phosphate acyltransferase